MHVWLICKCLGWRTVVPRLVQKAWYAVYRAVYTVAHASRTRSCWNRSGTEGMKKRQWKSIAACRISAPFIRKMHFSSFLVHWLGPEGKTFRVWCRTFGADPEGCTDALHKQNRKEKWFSFASGCLLSCSGQHKTCYVCAVTTNFHCAKDPSKSWMLIKMWL